MAFFRLKKKLRLHEKDLIYNLMKCADSSKIFPPDDSKKIQVLTNKLTNGRIFTTIFSVSFGFLAPIPLTGFDWVACAGFLSLFTHRLSKYLLFNTHYNTLYYYAVQFDVEKRVDSLEISDKRKVILHKMILHAKQDNFDFLAPGTQDNFIK